MSFKLNATPMKQPDDMDEAMAVDSKYKKYLQKVSVHSKPIHKGSGR